MKEQGNAPKFNHAYIGIQARAAGRGVMLRKEKRLMKVIFQDDAGQTFAKYEIDATNPHAAWALAHMKFEVDYPGEDAEKYCVEVEEDY